MSYFYCPRKWETRPPLELALPVRSRTLASLYVSGIAPLLLWHTGLFHHSKAQGKPSGFGGAEVFLAERSGVSWRAHSCAESPGTPGSITFY